MSDDFEPLTRDQRDLLVGLAYDAMGQAGGLSRDDQKRLGELANRADTELSRTVARLQRLEPLVAALAASDPADEGQLCAFCRSQHTGLRYDAKLGPIDKHWDGRTEPDAAVQARLVLVPQRPGRWYDVWHEPDCAWLRAYLLVGTEHDGPETVEEVRSRWRERVSVEVEEGTVSGNDEEYPQTVPTDVDEGWLMARFSVDPQADISCLTCGRWWRREGDHWVGVHVGHEPDPVPDA